MLDFYLTYGPLIVIGVLGALIGSFANVVIHRLPRGESVVVPGSHCPNCQHRLGPLELVPVVSWLALGGRCRSCGNRISVRYPLVELLTAAGFVLLAWRWPPTLYGATVLPLLAVYAMLVMLALIDIDTYLLPDSLTLPALLLALVGSFLYAPGSGLPTPAEALAGSVIAAGLLALINRLGALVLRRFRDTRERLWPISFDTINVAALGGALGGWPWGLALAAASVVINLVARRPLRLPEPLLYALWLGALLLAAGGWLVAPLTALGGSLAAAGAAALLGSFYWWGHDLLASLGKRHATANLADGALAAASTGSGADPADDEPVAMGFGDVKLAAVLGAVLGWEKVLVMLLLAVFAGTIGGVLGRFLGGGRQIPFGPYLAIGGLLALFLGDSVIAWYLSQLGL